jgi:hypothetical protein
MLIQTTINPQFAARNCQDQSDPTDPTDQPNPQSAIRNPQS